MRPNDVVQNRGVHAFGVWLRKRKPGIVGFALHGITLLTFFALFFAIRHWLPDSAQASEFENSIVLLAQILAVVVAVLLLGTTISLSSYNEADALADLRTELAAATAPLFNEFFVRHYRSHKLTRREFRLRLFSRMGLTSLLFSEDGRGTSSRRWFIFRPNWDGVWYQIAASPFGCTSRSDNEVAQIQTAHEVVICAYMLLEVVADFRSSGSALLGSKRGTNGTRWFLEEFDRFKKERKLKLPDEMDIEHATFVVSLALSSEHYMQEELSEHAANVEWGPLVLTTFLLHYAEYVGTLIHLVAKLQIFRWVSLVSRYPSMSPSSDEDQLGAAFSLARLNEVKQSLVNVKSKVITAHGAAKYFNSIKRWSVPGIGASLFVLAALLCSWPFIRWSAEPATRNLGFNLLYSAGVASLVESSFFLGRLLWKRRTAG